MDPLTFGTRAILLGTAAALVVGAVLAVGLEVGAPRRAAPRTGTAPLRGFGALAALAGGALLAVEVAIGRIAAERIGASLYTWTSVIGVVLLGVALGSSLGGRLADRVAPRRLLAGLLVFASLAVAAAIRTPAELQPMIARQHLPYATRTLLGVAVAFLLPAVALGTLAPAITRAALANPAADGRVVGRLGALGSLGAVLGTGVTALVLVPAVGIPLLLALIALVLALAAGFVRRRFDGLWLVGIAAAAWIAAGPLPFGFAADEALRPLRRDPPGTWVSDSRYMRIVVRPLDWRWFRPRQPPSASLWTERPDLARRVQIDAKDAFYW